ncbi:hypothetical protein DTO013E5_4136 [Penicillium roqueforti]|uniref:uncharacterized protein n=1 Tax=Penicillium roqueforti TaxID=5082 RepID=UPI001909F9BE|nr:uncharacterized protein LCP9604111_4123 [Penicillium roqueforti]KAF9249494.1 hypothetical protein LCP9604111_4123 [Penicillium roqueforti]KAI1835034.1 hypothetical protein CBS147337_3851 [Penicillium roqueforti]KAI2677047.1 hypothetical protein CBS147355_5274 [Penicillium roqueforti]KAI2688654.1 hypothetical protein LCP963914a_3056 [Penicillium roqueforti]KAI2718614.1 hypothetical protein CBS147354_6374 [Penicillium roqueforti]
MTVIFTYRNFSLEDITPLNGRVAVVTVSPLVISQPSNQVPQGGQAGIGKEITTQLLLHEIEKVIIVARSEDRYITARGEWRHRKGLSLENDLSNNIERVFATNCAGHQVLATLLLPLLKNSVTPSNDVRIVVTSSSFHCWCQKLDLDLLFSSSRVKWPALYDGVWRLEDGAATGLYLATSREVQEQNHRGRYFMPIATQCEPSAISGNMKLARDLWDWIDAQATETLGLD